MELEQKEATSASHEEGVSVSTHEETQKDKPRSLLFFVGAAVVVLVLGGLYVSNKENAPKEDELVSAPLSVGLDDSVPPVVAIVDGKEISAFLFTQQRQQIMQVAAAQGGNIEDPAVASEINTQAMEVVINNALLEQAAASAGFAPSAEDVDTQFMQIAGRFESEDAFTAEMEQAGVTEALLREDIANKLAVEEYLKADASWSSITVTDEEVSSAYDAYAETTPEIPPLADVAGQISEQLLVSKQQQLIGSIVEKLRAEAELKILI